MEKNVKQVLKTVKEYSIITLGLVLYVLAWSVFILPHNMVGGGVTGISAIIQYCTGIEVSYSYFVINGILLLLALKVLGKGFGAKTIFAIVVASLLFKLAPLAISPEFIKEIALDNGKMLCTIFGGVLSGFGVFLTFSQGGSSGGTDIIALMINKYRAISPGRILVIIDMIIIASSLIVPIEGATWGYRVATVIYGYVMSGVFSITVDMLISGNKQSVQIFIHSKKYTEIADKIAFEGKRGVTAISDQGWYTKTEGKLLMVIARKNETAMILNLIKSIDDQAFISVGNVMGVYGKGFDLIKK